MKEIWKDIKGYESLYKVSSFGNIKVLDRYVNCIPSRISFNGQKRFLKERLLDIKIENAGYEYVFLTKNKKTKKVRVHRIIAQAFIPNPEDKPHINHKDANKSNNDISNLEWCTPKENSQHAYNKGLLNIDNLLIYTEKIKRKIDMLDLKGNYIKTFNSITDAYTYFGRNYQGGINECLNGKRHKALNYKWRDHIE